MIALKNCLNTFKSNVTQPAAAQIQQFNTKKYVAFVSSLTLKIPVESQ